MRPKPTREWVMQELERLQVRVVSGRVGRNSGEGGGGGGGGERGRDMDGYPRDDGGLISSLQIGPQDSSAHLSRTDQRSLGVNRRGSITDTLLTVAGAERNMSIGLGGGGSMRDSMGWSSMMGGSSGDPMLESMWQQPHRNSSMNLTRSLLLSDQYYDGSNRHSDRAFSLGMMGGGGSNYGSYLGSSTLNDEYPISSPGGRIEGPNGKGGGGSGSNRDVGSSRRKSSSPSSPSPPIAPPHRPLVGGGSAAAYEAAREEHYRQLAEKKKKEAVESNKNIDKNSNDVAAMNGNERSFHSTNNHSRNLHNPDMMGVGPPGSGPGLSASARQHYEMLKLHHMNLMNEIRETSMMINLYEQQLLGNSTGGGPGRYGDSGMAGGSSDPMQHLLQQRRFQMDQNSGNGGAQQLSAMRRHSGGGSNGLITSDQEELRRLQTLQMKNDMMLQRRLSDVSLGGYGGFMPRGSDVSFGAGLSAGPPSRMSYHSQVPSMNSGTISGNQGPSTYTKTSDHDREKFPKESRGMKRNLDQSNDNRDEDVNDDPNKKRLAKEMEQANKKERGDL